VVLFIVFTNLFFGVFLGLLLINIVKTFGFNAIKSVSLRYKVRCKHLQLVDFTTSETSKEFESLGMAVWFTKEKKIRLCCFCIYQKNLPFLFTMFVVSFNSFIRSYRIILSIHVYYRYSGLTSTGNKFVT
jgi:hypothetical protein